MLTSLEANEVLTVRTYKTVPGNKIAWANTYEVVPTVAVTDPLEVINKLEALRDIFINLERGMLNAAYTLDRIIISTYVPDGEPYNPFTFVTFSVNQAGDYFTPGNPLLPLEFCTLVKRGVVYGRQGNILYRGVVAANDAIVGPAGAVIVGARVSQLNVLLDQFKAALNSNSWKLVLASGQEAPDLSTLREVTTLTIKETMRFKKLNNRYFDRAMDTN